MRERTCRINEKGTLLWFGYIERMADVCLTKQNKGVIPINLI